MKRFSIVLFAAVFAAIGLSSCGNKSLKGTSWKSEVMGKDQVVFNFTSESECEEVFYWNGKEDGTLKGTYTYNYPNVTIDCGFDATFTGFVDGNKMTLTHEDGVIIVLTKQ